MNYFMFIGSDSLTELLYIIGGIMKKLIRFGYLLVFCLSLLGCSMPASERPGLSVQLRAPRSGMVVALPADIVVLADAEVPAANVTRMIFYANGLVIGEDASPAPSGVFTSGSVHWSPTEPGEYLVQAEALRSDGSAFTAAARVCVLPAITDPTANYLIFQQYGYTGPCEVPAPNPLTPRGAEVSMVAHAIPGSLAYESRCTVVVGIPTIAFQATVDDPSDQVVFVSVDYSVPSRDSADTVINDTIALNWTSSSTSGEKIFTGTTEDLTPMLQGEFQGDGGILTWTARALNRDGEVLAVDGPHEITASPCVALVIGAPMPLIIEWTPTFTPIPTETLTPTLVPYVPPTKKPDDGGGNPKPGGDGPKCSSYGDKDSCSAAGCSWDPDKKACN
jgi:hypothetical protein